METEKSIVKKEMPPSFIEKLMVNSETLEEIKKVGEVIIASGFCPDHFKTSKDAVGIVMCIEAGRQLGLTWMQSLSDLYPVKGRIGMMGAAARSLIFSSGVLDKWEEMTEGEYPDDKYKHIIISKRKGLPGEFRSEFSVMDAKKAGLFSRDIYQRYGKRMIMWRNIGFHATDYYGDVMKGFKTVEELNDFDAITPGTETTVLKTDEGTEITIKGADKGKSSKLTTRVADKIQPEKFAPVNTGRENIQEAEVILSEEEKRTILGTLPIKSENETGPAFIVRYNETVELLKKKYPNLGLIPLLADESPFKAEKDSVEYFMGIKVCGHDGDGNPLDEAGNRIGATDTPDPGEEGGGAPAETAGWTLKQMEEMDTAVLLAKVNSDTDMIEASELIGGKNTNKKLRGIIFAWQSGELAEYVAKVMPRDEPPTQEPSKGTPEDPGSLPNKEFDKQKSEKEIDDFLNGPSKGKGVSIVNKYNLEIPDYDKGQEREFSTMKKLFNMMAGLNPSLNNPRYLELGAKKGFLEKYPSREDFCRLATVAEINLLLNEN